MNSPPRASAARRTAYHLVVEATARGLVCDLQARDPALTDAVADKLSALVERALRDGEIDDKDKD
jgi:hypothetical protein